MSKKKIVDKEAGDSAEMKKHSPRKWAAAKAMTTAEMLWHKVVDHDDHSRMSNNRRKKIEEHNQNE